VADQKVILCVTPGVEPYNDLASEDVRVIWCRTPDDVSKRLAATPHIDLQILAGWFDYPAIEELRKLAPIVAILTKRAFDKELDKFRSFASDFLVEGFEIEEMKARIGAVLSGKGGAPVPAPARAAAAPPPVDHAGNAELDAAKAALLMVRSELGSAKAEATAAKAEAAAANAKAAALSAAATPLPAGSSKADIAAAATLELGAVKADLAAAKAEAAGAKSELSSAKSELAKAKAELAAAKSMPAPARAEPAQVAVSSENYTSRANVLDILVYDVRSPMASIEVGLEFLRSDEKGLNPVHKKVVQKLYHSCLDIKLSLENFIDLEMIDKEPLPIEKTPQDLRTLIRDAVAPIKDHLSGRGVEVEFEMAASTPLPVSGDEKLLKRAFANVALAAGSMADAGSPLRIRAKTDPVGLYIDVENGAPAIPEDVREMIFDRFMHRSKSGWNFPRGFATALAYCRWIVESHGGKVSVAGVQPSGNRFSFFLPGLNSPSAPKEKK
jgi:K+-sensing histidine kinase KdpD